jgi:EPS-associated MarR family transcriptional regulator
MPPLNDEMRYRLLKLLEDDPNISQRSLAMALGISLGKTNYCLKALINRGCVKVNNLIRNDHKRGYAYYLTRKGIEEKARVSIRFLKSRMDEYEKLKEEIEQLKYEVGFSET